MMAELLLRQALLRKRVMPFLNHQYHY